MITTPTTEQVSNQEWNKIITMARNNGFPEQTIHKLRNKLICKKERPLQAQPMQQHNKDGSPLPITAPQYEKSLIYSDTPTCK